MLLFFQSTAIFQGMIPLSPQSSAVAFPLAQQSKLSNNKMIDTFDKTKVLLSGVTQSAIFSGSAGHGHGAYIQTDPVVEWFDKEYFRVDGDGSDTNRVPLLREERGRLSIAGVDTGDGRRPITDATMTKIESALSKFRTNIYHTILKIDEKREQGSYLYTPLTFCACFLDYDDSNKSASMLFYVQFYLTRGLVNTKEMIAGTRRSKIRHHCSI